MLTGPMVTLYWLEEQVTKGVTVPLIAGGKKKKSGYLLPHFGQSQELPELESKGIFDILISPIIQKYST